MRSLSTCASVTPSFGSPTWNKIVTKAEAKLGAAKEDRGQVPPRVILQVLEQGTWCDAEVMSEYFGGILAASRSPDGVDDRGASWAALVSRLSTADVYLHYLAYDAFRRLYLGQDLALGDNQVRDTRDVYLSAGEILSAMGLEVTDENWGKTVVPSLTALIREDLVGATHTAGPQAHLETRKQIDSPDTGLTFVPSVPGIELFLWAHGHGSLPVGSILDPALTFEPVADLGSVPGARRVEDMRRERNERIAAEQENQASEG
jgi:hypothetical protein